MPLPVPSPVLNLGVTPSMPPFFLDVFKLKGVMETEVAAEWGPVTFLSVPHV
jgi:hypothetical protein